jgi:hypothetical protein
MLNIFLTMHNNKESYSNNMSINNIANMCTKMIITNMMIINTVNLKNYKAILSKNNNKPNMKMKKILVKNSNKNKMIKKQKQNTKNHRNQNYISPLKREIEKYFPPIIYSDGLDK